MNDFSDHAILKFNEDHKTHLSRSKSQFRFNDFTLPSNLRSSLKRTSKVIP